MITVLSTQDVERVREARGHAAGEAGWLVFHIALSSFAGWLAWTGLSGVWPALLWLLAGAVASDALNGFGSTAVAVRDWRRMQTSPAFRALTRDLDAAHEQVTRSYRAARRAETDRAGTDRAGADGTATGGRGASR